MNITILGTGNWATDLDKAFTKKGHQLIYSARTPEIKRAHQNYLPFAASYTHCCHYGAIIFIKNKTFFCFKLLIINISIIFSTTYFYSNYL